MVRTWKKPALSLLAERGKRLDQTSGSAGLGLNLVTEILSAYGTEPVFANAPLGGLSVSFKLPAGG